MLLKLLVKYALLSYSSYFTTRAKIFCSAADCFWRSLWQHTLPRKTQISRDIGGRPSLAAFSLSPKDATASHTSSGVTWPPECSWRSTLTVYRRINSSLYPTLFPLCIPLLEAMQLAGLYGPEMHVSTRTKAKPHISSQLYQQSVYFTW